MEQIERMEDNKFKLKQRCIKLCGCCEELQNLKKDITKNLTVHIEMNEIFAITYQGVKYYKKNEN